MWVFIFFLVDLEEGVLCWSDVVGRKVEMEGFMFFPFCFVFVVGLEECFGKICECFFLSFGNREERVGAFSQNALEKCLGVWHD